MISLGMCNVKNFDLEKAIYPVYNSVPSCLKWDNNTYSPKVVVRIKWDNPLNALKPNVSMW